MFQLTCDAILFDLDGVLVDSSAVIERQWRRWATQNGIDMAAIQRIWHGRRATEIISEVAPHLNVAEEAKWMRDAEANDIEGVIAHAGALALLRLLPEGAWAIATSGPHPVAVARLNAVGLPIPTTFITGDDVRHGKPNPEPYLRAAEGLGIAPDRCVVIEDAVAGVSAGLAAGAQVIAVPTSHEPTELRHATAILPRLADLHVTITVDGAIPQLDLVGPTH